MLFSQEEMANSKKYKLLDGVSIFLPLKKEAPHQRYPLSMDIQDHLHQKDVVNFHHLVEEMAKWWKKSVQNPTAKFPEGEFRARFGSHAPQPSWYHVSETMKFQICEFSPNQKLPESLENFEEFLRFWSKKSGWFKYTGGPSDFLPANDRDSWVKAMAPKKTWTGTKVYYNAEVCPNTPEWFNYNRPLEMNPQTGVLGNNIPLYVLGKV